MISMDGKTQPEALKAACPICRKPAEKGFEPFCSQRCADVDLGRWLGERYVIPGPGSEPEEEHGENSSH